MKPVLSSLSLHYLPLSISSGSVGDEPFICGGQAFICQSTGTVPAGGTDAGTGEDNSGKKKKNKCESTNMLITWAQAQTRYTAHTCLFHGVEKMHTRLKIHTCSCPHQAILWDTGGPRFLLSVWWATGRHAPASPRRREAPGLEGGQVGGG